MKPLPASGEREGSIDVDTAGAIELLRSWAHSAYDRFLRGSLAGRLAGAVLCLCKCARVKHICVCSLGRKCQLFVVRVCMWFRRTILYRRHSPWFSWVFWEGSEALRAWCKVRVIAAWVGNSTGLSV